MRNIATEQALLLASRQAVVLNRRVFPIWAFSRYPRAIPDSVDGIAGRGNDTTPCPPASVQVPQQCGGSGSSDRQEAGMRICSGLLYSGVRITALRGIWEGASAGSSSNLAIPKSSSFTAPLSVTRTFPGFKSRIL